MIFVWEKISQSRLIPTPEIGFLENVWTKISTIPQWGLSLNLTSGEKRFRMMTRIITWRRDTDFHFSLKLKMAFKTSFVPGELSEKFSKATW